MCNLRQQCQCGNCPKSWWRQVFWWDDALWESCRWNTWRELQCHEILPWFYLDEYPDTTKQTRIPQENITFCVAKLSYLDQIKETISCINQMQTSHFVTNPQLVLTVRHGQRKVFELQKRKHYVTVPNKVYTDHEHTEILLMKFNSP